MASALPTEQHGRAVKRLPVTTRIWELLSEMKRPGETFDQLLGEMIAHEQAYRLNEELNRIEGHSTFVSIDELNPKG